MNQLPFGLMKNSIVRWLVLGMMFVVLAIAITLATNHAARIRVGDGSEYYAMELAWSQTQRPYMTDKGWAAYADEFNRSDIIHMVPPTQLRDGFPALRLGATADFNHFWMYSALAAATGKVISTAGMASDPHLSFLLLHATLCALLLVLCCHWHGRPGFLTALFLIFCSPILWYITKVHTEFFTFCLTTLAMAAVMRRFWAFAAITLAVVSTQNISFALPALFCSICTLLSLARGQRTGVQAALDVILLSATAVVTLLHPFYYFSRYGAFTPQLIAGGATLKYSDLLMPLNFLFDPEVGLLPNWPLATAAALVCAFALIRLRRSPNYHVLAFVTIYLLAALLAQGATTNINSGASVYISRYGLWYICLFYPLYVATLCAIGKPILRTRIVAYSGITIFALIAAIVNGCEYAPNKDENYLSPSPVASLIYRFMPGLYDPNIEIFSERNAGIDEAVPPRPSIILGPNCHKALILTGLGDAPAIFGHSLCGLSQSAVRRLAYAAGGWNESSESHHYFTITQAQLDDTLPRVTRGSDLVFNSHSTFGSEYLISGWSQPDDWGVWSDSDLAHIRMRVENNVSGPVKVSLSMNGFFFGKHRDLVITPIIDAKRMPAFTLNADMPMPVTRKWTLPPEVLHVQNGVIDIKLDINQPRSPAELGASADLRKLGIQLTSIHIE